MRWTVLLVLAALVLPASAAANGPAEVRLLACAPGEATFEGDMTAVRGAMSMQMRFTLLARDGDTWKRVSGARLDTWVTSNPGKRRYVYDKHVAGLVVPGRYRVRVRFRWLDASGAVIRRAHRRSRICTQPDLRPDLRLASLRQVEGGYELTVRNTGRSLADPFDVSLTLPGGEPQRERAESLLPGRKTTLTFAGPACTSGDMLQVVLDVADEVDEAAETDDTASLACPVGR